MIKAIRKMMNKPITLNLIGHGPDDIEQMGGGISRNAPGMVLILRGLDLHWLAAGWKHSGQTIVIPAADIVCIASDL